MRFKNIFSGILAFIMLMTLVPAAALTVSAETVFVSEDFESGTLPQGWTSTGDKNTFYFAEISQNGSFSSNGSFSAFCNGSSADEVSSLITPKIDLSDFDTASLSFYYMNPIWAGDCNVISISWSESADGTFLELWNSNTAFSNSWTEKTVSLDALCGKKVFISFNSTSGYGYCTGFDNISITSDTTRIDEVNSNFENPVIDGTPSFKTSIPASYPYTATIKWWLGDVELGKDHVFLQNVTYKREVYFVPKNAFFDYSTIVDGRGVFTGKVTINGTETTSCYVVTDSTSPFYGSLCVYEYLVPVDSYMVIFESNGHGNSPSPVMGLAFGDKISEPASLTASGWLFAGWYTDSELTKPFDFKNDRVMSNITLYAKWVKGSSADWFALSLYGGKNQNKWIGFDANDPSTVTVAGSEESGYLTHAASYHEGFVYGCNSVNNTVYKAEFDGKTMGKYVVLNASNQYKLNDMSYDESRNTMYAVGDKDEKTFLLTVDLATGAVSPVAEIDRYISTLAIDTDGNAYCISINTDKLYRIDLANGARTEVGDLGYNANYTQTMEFDPNSGLLYWASCGPTAPYSLRVVDISTAISFVIGNVECSTGLEMAGLFAFYAMADYTAYNDAVKRAEALNKNGYTPETWALLEEALAVDVSGLRKSEQKRVSDAAKAIINAIDSLETIAMLGDVNGDNYIDSTDYFIAKRIVLGTFKSDDDLVSRGDIDRNGSIDTSDYLKIKRHVLGTYVIE